MSNQTPLKKHELINIIESLGAFSSPKLRYEQYITNPIATADLFYYIAYEHQDLYGNLMLDFGCGPGNLSIAGALLGASHVIGIDIDSNALEIAETNAKKLHLASKITFLQADITSPDFPIENSKIYSLINQFSTNTQKILIVLNPPFGVHQKGIDMLFIQQALKMGNIIYSIHLSTKNSELFIRKKLEKLGGFITHQAKMDLLLKKTYYHHQKKRKFIQTDVFRILPTPL